MLGSALGSVSGAQIVNAFGFNTLFYLISGILLGCWILTTVKIKREATFSHVAPTCSRSISPE